MLAQSTAQIERNEEEVNTEYEEMKRNIKKKPVGFYGKNSQIFTIIFTVAQTIQEMRRTIRINVEGHSSALCSIV